MCFIFSSETQETNMRVQYRTFQLYGSIARETVAPTLAGAFAYLSLLTIFGFAIVIYFSDKLNLLIFICFGLFNTVTLTGMGFYAMLGTKVRETSLRALTNIESLKSEKEFVRSCRPIQVYIGDFFPITTSTFFLELMAFIDSNIVNLLVLLKDLK